eukprot:TRINITY_DN1560_c0_g1_i1.p3 TRINITY_DN1560_c0_g1~~TRINITY_DN1560_c0_g1_i1.p3  ORF type:complete len:407 (-),score=60.34 TRINITY_DN1560_c0_g1_i1:1312-2532(-)
MLCIYKFINIIKKQMEEQTEEKNVALNSSSGEEEEEEEQVHDLDSPGKDVEEVENEEDGNDFQDKFALKDLWSGSSKFRFILIGFIAGIAVIFIGTVASLAVLYKEGQKLDDEKALVSNYQDSYQNCTKTVEYQESAIQNLTSELENATDTLNSLTAAANALEQENANLVKEIAATELKVNNSKLAKVLWQVGTGVGGAATLGGSIYAMARAGAVRKCDSNKENLNDHFNSFKLRLENVTALKANYVAMSKNGYYLTTTECYNSGPESYFSKDTLYSQCKGGSGYLFEMRSDAKTTFGLYFNKDLPENENEYVQDANAFVYFRKDGTIGNLKKDKIDVLKFTSDRLLTIGNDEIVVYESKYAPARVVTNPGTSFELAGSSYHSSKEFHLEKLVVYKLSINYPNPQY